MPKILSVFATIIVATLLEICGRFRVFNMVNLFFTIFTIAGVLSSNLSMLVTFRFFNGLTVASLPPDPAIIADVFAQDERGRPMVIINLSRLLGPVVAPIIGGYMA